MKKSFLALAVAAVAAASVAQATTIYDKDGTSISMYGRVQSTYYSAKSGNSPAADYNDSGLATKARLAFDFRSTLTSWADAFAKAEWQAADGNKGEGNGDGYGSDDFNARYLWLGVDFGQFGSVKFGKFEDAVKYTIATTDIFEDFGCVGQLGNDDRRNGQMMYEWSGYGVDVKASVQGAADNQQVDGAYFASTREKLDIDVGGALAVGYTSPDVLFGPISVKAAYGYVQFQGDDSYGYKAPATNNHGNVSGYDNYKQWAASISWGGATGFFTGLTYQQRDFSMYDGTSIEDKPITVVDDYKVQGTEFVVRYGWNNGVAIKAAYEWQNLDMDGANSPDLDAKVANLQLEWQMTPNFKIWTEARWDVDTDNGYDDLCSTNYESDIYSIGARYNF